MEANSKRQAVPDLFGILRKKCQACKEACAGYQPQGVICPGPSNQLDFPTFCQNCGCPACFHDMLKPKGQLPEPILEAMRSFNITQRDINFNAAVMLLRVGDEESLTSNLGQLISLLRNSGLELLSLDQRVLDPNEALYLRIRQLRMMDDDLAARLNNGYDRDQVM